MKPFDLRSILSFGVVGILATVTHALVAIALIEICSLHPFSANAFGFVTGFMVSYFGHHRFSFQSEAGHRRAMPRFLAIAGLGLFLNQVIVYLMVNLGGVNYFLALCVIILTVPAITYLTSRRWAFAKPSS
ncbi:GtrA family protein [Ruegeria atlantica]|uniref:GtrA family protein n=1 Tax=Ruegeria atlantica TaxID=81569 RepID=A0AA90Z4S8_9RHOB|nr:GtrA family protein [Ruegeria atlantica]